MRAVKFQFWDELNSRMWNANDAGETMSGWTFQCFADKSNQFKGIIYQTVDVGFGPNDGPTDEHELICRQYTGLIDMNGTEIYEGDIFEGHKKFVVEYDEYYGGFLPFTDDGGCGCCSDGSAGQTGYAGEVIGNVHENPELLEGTE